MTKDTKTFRIESEIGRNVADYIFNKAKKRIKELEAEVKLKRRALEQLEELAAHHEDPEDKSQNQKDWNRVYKVLHTINSPDCRKNHPNWIEEITPQTLRSKL